METQKTSQEIFPVEERLKTVAVIGTNAGRTVAQQIARSDKEPLLRRYHKALEASEQQVKELEAGRKQQLIDFMEGLRAYVHESGTNIAHDERESIEFVEIFLNNNRNE